jgi:histone H2A
MISRAPKLNRVSIVSLCYTLRDISPRHAPFLKRLLLRPLAPDSMSRLTTSEKNPRGKRSQISRSKRAGLIFPVGRAARFLRRGRYATRIGDAAPVYLSAALEYLTAEVLELAGNACRDDKRQRIIPRHIVVAVRRDEELNKLFSRVTIASGGVLPNLHAALLPHKKEKKGESETPEGDATNPDVPKLKAMKALPRKKSSESTKKRAPATSPSKKKKKASEDKDPKKEGEKTPKAKQAPFAQENKKEEKPSQEKEGDGPSDCKKEEKATGRDSEKEKEEVKDTDKEEKENAGANNPGDKEKESGDESQQKEESESKLKKSAPDAEKPASMEYAHSDE